MVLTTQSSIGSDYGNRVYHEVAYYSLPNQSGGAATEIECELKLPAGTYYLVYLNDQQTAMGGAANIEFYRPN